MEVKELWKPLLEYKGIEVSSIGRIRKAANKRRKERILTEFPKDRDGYCRCSVQKLDGTWTSQPVHRLVAKAFIPNPYKLPEVNHKDCNKYNNKVTNLEWVSKHDNMKHASIYSYKHREELSPLTQDHVRLIPILLKYGFSIKLIASL